MANHYNKIMRIFSTILAVFVLFGIFFSSAYCQTKATPITQIEEQICQKRFGGACVLAQQKHILGTWERVGGSLPLKGVTRYQVFMFTAEGQAAEKKISAPYSEMNKVMPGFMKAGKKTSYEFKNGMLSISSKQKSSKITEH